MVEPTLAIIGLVLSAFFSATEIAFHQANPLQLAVWRERGYETANLTEQFLGKPDRYLITVLVGTNLANVLTSSYATITLIHLGLPQLWILITISAVILVFGEILPKSFSRERATSMAVFNTPFLRASEILFTPIVWIARSYASLFPDGKEKSTTHFLNRNELKILFDEMEVSEELEAEEKEVIINIFDFGSQPVRAAMTSRADIIGLHEDASVEDAVQLMASTGLSKLVLYRDSLDQIQGIVFLHDLFSEAESLYEIAHRPLFISETMTSSEALRELKRYRSTLAIVVGVDGKASGLVTVEDLIEELFGEFEDVFDQETKRVSRLTDGSFVMDGRMDLEELESESGVRLPKGNYETIGGFIIHRLGRIPTPGEKLESAGFRIRILRSTPSQVERIHIRKK
ncbi:MAG TPA: HlyC/CorC family transporter [Candidatus Marinimicrobia bacterium]|jgi:CBS domain containing-hemolysin-like protein|nr:HlyC/CorC family transporter [Candidatus Neomarinimicrobiota bacterium]HIO75206.1 HlyC/CorC family transporter [Candidatus Neomarinimicrobiota bacterium]